MDESGWGRAEGGRVEGGLDSGSYLNGRVVKADARHIYRQVYPYSYTRNVSVVRGMNNVYLAE